MEQNQDLQRGQNGLGCRVLLLVIVGCFVFAGLIFFIGREIDGDRGSYYLFYTILILAIVAATVYQIFTLRKRKRQS